MLPFGASLVCLAQVPIVKLYPFTSRTLTAHVGLSCTALMIPVAAKPSARMIPRHGILGFGGMRTMFLLMRT